MKGFLLGIVTVALVLAVGLALALMGFVGMRADKPPSKIETIVAGHAMDASVARSAPKMANPVIADEANLAAGARLYREHCTLCHGDPAHPKAALVDSLNCRASVHEGHGGHAGESEFLHFAARYSVDRDAWLEERVKRAADLATGDVSQPHARPSAHSQASFTDDGAAKGIPVAANERVRTAWWFVHLNIFGKFRRRSVWRS